MSIFDKLTALALIALHSFSFSEEKNFLLYDLNTEQWLQESGTLCDDRVSPCSTFKIPLSLMGFDSTILIDENSPKWLFQEGYVDYLPIWKNPQTPQLWMRNSCVWFSQVLTSQMGMQRFQSYVDAFDYGNKDLSGEPGKNNGLTHAWLGSSLKITPREQIFFLSKLVRNDLPVSPHSLEMTRRILFLEEFPGGWKLYAKTGSQALENPDLKAGWFVGWLEKEARKVLFAFYLRDTEVVGGIGGYRAKEAAKKLLLEFCSANSL